ncbi:CCA-adding enzyme Cca [Thermoclostridium stercorarium subsp. stercorarium DSM 8532]|jgi:tRNA nucleotidyltransferase (CCA-adding enzyme)|uniref:CCA-adding enzyme Cca n=3 Tax=Thermoclostridium stercorarium TaxID=1510 RepID=L7VPA5_THES1|nr:CCA tRNA nucleotidyltransferase [Thermoclostridium stercorarium]AGC68607.1 CCA-adding enzyme Cca [Thermoclostridium stercorarium subsp. stercorarium DSM 8532]AGI39618.1 tRNA nucleotidyltransferase [Thermoclostridium stercorarium subsp. stercorarium DSM 8532]ANW98951.1 CCA-adding protein [Thermoclostridium stercorarium subsp. thermolacticum DSM 2910]ANX01480.1 CCA-adding protein [Thermoclostridium stercorarium subsp. leptospartum DSM 9219]UZQ84587.1 CCA tRNA nucleotidyltransferase [Thermoclo
MHLPDEVMTIINTLEKHGYEAYIVGGCVRDMLLGLKPKDYDICTSAYPEQVMELFPRSIPTGIKHGTVTVIINNTPFEVTTFRIESGYTDFRHPEKVIFSDSLTEDLKRRDFTINAMAYHPVKGVIDPFNGINDLRKMVIRTVGNPRERFGEDALRMLRAIRFQAAYGFSIDPDTFSAIKELSGNISAISRERILEELNKTLLSSHTEAFGSLFETGLLKFIFPVFFSEKGDFSLLKKLPEEISTRWAGFLWLAEIRDPGNIKEICSCLRMSNKLKNDILKISVTLKTGLPKNQFVMRLTLADTGCEPFARALNIMKAFGLYQTNISDAEISFERIIAEKHCLSLSELAVNGSDLIAMGVKPGKNLGVILNTLFLCVLQNPDLNRKDILIHFAGIINNKFGNREALDF